MASKKARSKYVVVDADKARESIPATPTDVSRAAGCAPATIKDILAGVPKTKISCEKFVNGCLKLGCKTISMSHIQKIA